MDPEPKFETETGLWEPLATLRIVGALEKARKVAFHYARPYGPLP